MPQIEEAQIEEAQIEETQIEETQIEETQMANVVGKLTMKVFTLAVGIPVGIAVKRLVERLWHSARPGDPPRDPHERGVRWGDALGWAALSAASVVAKDLITRRGAEETWRFVVGTEPPPAPPTKAEKKLAKAQEKIAVGTDGTAGTAGAASTD